MQAFERNPNLISIAFESMVSHLRNHQGRDSQSNAANSHWSGLADDLQKLGVDKQTCDALVSWASSRPEVPSPLRIRVLHPMERELLTTEAFNDLLELYRLGLLLPQQVENVIENCAYLPSLPAPKEQVRKLALRVFSEQFLNMGFGASH